MWMARAEVSNCLPTGWMSHAETTPTPALAMGKKDMIHHNMSHDKKSLTPLT